MKKLLTITTALVALIAPAAAEQYWLPQEGVSLPTTIAGDWCMFAERKADPSIPEGRSQSYKPEGCNSMTVSESGLSWPSTGMTCVPTHVSAWWKNVERWNAWRVSATCQSAKVSPTKYEFEFIHVIPGPRPASCLKSKGCEWWPSLIISTAPFIPDEVRNAIVAPAPLAETTTKSKPAVEARPKDEKPPPPIPAVGEKITTEFFRYVKDKKHFDCQEAVKKRAEYGIRSPGVLYGTNYNADAFLRFSRMSARVDGDGNMDLAGDEAEAQNAAGSWVGVKYVCTVNVETLEVRDVTLMRRRFVD
jgi:hypothetical protein